MLPQRIEELKRSAAKAGAITALSRAKAWQADLDPKDLASGCPSVKEDGSPFSATNFAEIVRRMHPLARKLAEDTDMSQYQAVYDAENKKVKVPVHEAQVLIPPTRKHTFAPEIDPAGLIDEEAQFEALSGIDWKSSTFQVLGSAGGEDRNEPETSTQQAS